MINTVEMTNRFKGLGVVDRVTQELWVEGCDITWEVVTKTTRKKCTKEICIYSQAVFLRAISV